MDLSDVVRPEWTVLCRTCGRWVRVDSPNCRSVEDTHYTMLFEHVHCPPKIVEVDDA